MEKPEYEELEHTADWALRVRGGDLAELLQNAAGGMLQLAGARPGVGPGKRITFSVEAPDSESLLVKWLEELLFNMETRWVTYSDIKVRLLQDGSLEASAIELPLATIEKEIKAVTFHNLKITSHPDGLKANVVFDV